MHVPLVLSVMLCTVPSAVGFIAAPFKKYNAWLLISLLWSVLFPLLNGSMPLPQKCNAWLLISLLRTALFPLLCGSMTLSQKI